jgi:hypothetical protein
VLDVLRNTLMIATTKTTTTTATPMRTRCCRRRLVRCCCHCRGRLSGFRDFLIIVIMIIVVAVGVLINNMVVPHNQNCHIVHHTIHCNNHDNKAYPLSASPWPLLPSSLWYT